MNATFEELLIERGPFKHICAECATEYESGERWDIYSACSEPCLLALQTKEAEKLELARIERIATLRAEAATIVRVAVPPRLFNTDLGHARFNRRAWAAVEKWTPTDEKPWLGLVGITGSCKTRMGIMLASELLSDMAAKCEKRCAFEFVSVYHIARWAIAQYSNNGDEKHDATRWLNALRCADLLLVDDLDKTRFTPAITEVIFELFDGRHGYGNPTIWTANSTAEEIGGMMAPQFGPAFAGRLNDCSKTYSLK